MATDYERSCHGDFQPTNVHQPLNCICGGATPAQKVQHKMADFEGILGLHFQTSNERGQIYLCCFLSPPPRHFEAKTERNL